MRASLVYDPEKHTVKCTMYTYKDGHQLWSLEIEDDSNNEITVTGYPKDLTHFLAIVARVLRNPEQHVQEDLIAK